MTDHTEVPTHRAFALATQDENTVETPHLRGGFWITIPHLCSIYRHDMPQDDNGSR